MSRTPDLTPPTPASPAITDADYRFLRALDDPDADIDPFVYAQWVKRPEIQEALAGRDALIANRERLRDAAHRREALDDARFARACLRKVIEAAADLTDDKQRADHRRAAAALGRIALGRIASSRTPSSPLGGGGRAWAARPVGAHAPPASSAPSTDQPCPDTRPLFRTPDPSLTRLDILNLAAAALANPAEVALEELQEFITAPAYGAAPDLPAVAAAFDFQAAPAVSVQYYTNFSNDQHASFEIRLERRGAPAAAFTLQLSRQQRGRHRGCWMIDHLRAHLPSPNTS